MNRERLPFVRILVNKTGQWKMLQPEDEIREWFRTAKKTPKFLLSFGEKSIVELRGLERTRGSNLTSPGPK